MQVPPKDYKTASKREQTMIQQRTCVLSKHGDGDDVKAKYKVLYISPQCFLFRYHGSLCDAFPGELES